MSPFIDGGTIARQNSRLRQQMGGGTPAATPQKPGVAGAMPPPMDEELPPPFHAHPATPTTLLVDATPRPLPVAEATRRPSGDRGKPIPGSPIRMSPAPSPMQTSPTHAPINGSVPGMSSPKTPLPASPLGPTADSDDGVVYELFSILIHSGSALGGHYYAYIRDFERDEWFNFNDSSVSRLSKEDIQQVYGSANGSSWSSCANAYMLMYRARDASRNTRTVPDQLVPVELQQLLQREAEAAQEQEQQRQREANQLTLQISYQGVQKPVLVGKHDTLSTALVAACAAFAVLVDEDAVRACSADLCMRLRALKAASQLPGEPYHSPDQLRKTMVQLNTFNLKSFVLEGRSPDEPWPPWSPTDLVLRVSLYTAASDSLLKEQHVTVHNDADLATLRTALHKLLGVPPGQQRLLKELTWYGSAAELLTGDERRLRSDLRVYEGSKLFLEDTALSPTTDTAGPDDEGWQQSALYLKVQKLKNEITVLFTPLNSSEFTFKVRADQHHSLQQLKELMADMLRVPAEGFRIWREGSAWRHELTRLQETLQQNGLCNQSKLTVESGRALKPGELTLVVHLFDPNNVGKPFEKLFDWVAKEDVTIEALKGQLCTKLQEEVDKDKPGDAPTPSAASTDGVVPMDEDPAQPPPVPSSTPWVPTHMRLWEMTSSSPSNVLIDSLPLKEACKSSLLEQKHIAVQRLERADRKRKKEQLVLYVQQWHPEAFNLPRARHEVVLSESDSLDEFRKQLVPLAAPSTEVAVEDSDGDQPMSNPEGPVAFEDISVAKSHSDFSGMEVLEIPDLKWEPATAAVTTGHVKNAPLYLNDGDLVYFSDKRQKLKTLSKEERSVLAAEAEKRRCTTTPSAYTYTRPKEKGLKIKSKHKAEVDTNPEPSEAI